MITCTRCGDRTPRLTLDQRRCPPCQLAVANTIRLDERRRTRFPFAKSLGPWRPAA